MIINKEPIVSVFTIAKTLKRSVPNVIRAMESGDFYVGSLELHETKWRARTSDVQKYFAKK